jgi:hypothetical protein
MINCRAFDCEGEKPFAGPSQLMRDCDVQIHRCDTGLQITFAEVRQVSATRVEDAFL